MRLSAPLLLHPGRAALDASVSGTPTDRVAEHVARCATCRDTLAFRRALREAAGRLPAPEPAPNALADVLEARARGDRFVLRHDVPDTRARRRLGRVALAAAAAACVIATPAVVRWGQSEYAHRGVIGAPTDDIARVASRATSTGTFASIAVASDAPGLLAAPALEPVNGERLRPMRLSYASRIIGSDDREMLFDGDGTIALVKARAPNGETSWRVTREWHGGDWSRGGRAETEVLWLEPDRLRPIARTVRISPYSARYRLLTVTQRFLGDRIAGEVRADDVDGTSVTRPIARSLSRADAPYLTDALVPLFLGAFTPTYGWRGRASVTGWGVVPNDVSYPVAMRVVGDARVTVASGTFDCWHLVATSRGRAVDLWVRKRDGVAIRWLDASSTSTRGRRETVLVGETP